MFALCVYVHMYLVGSIVLVQRLKGREPTPCTLLHNVLGRYISAPHTPTLLPIPIPSYLISSHLINVNIKNSTTSQSITNKMSSSKKAIVTDQAPKPLPGIYNAAIVANGFVYCSGQVPMDPTTNKLIDGDVAAHTVCFWLSASPLAFLFLAFSVYPNLRLSRSPSDHIIMIIQHQCIKNLGAVLNAAGSSLEQVVEVNVFLADMADFAKMNEVYKTYWGDVKPARTWVTHPHSKQQLWRAHTTHTDI